MDDKYKPKKHLRLVTDSVEETYDIPPLDEILKEIKDDEIIDQYCDKLADMLVNDKITLDQAESIFGTMFIEVAAARLFQADVKYWHPSDAIRMQEQLVNNIAEQLVLLWSKK